MKARQLIERASFGPEALKVICYAFDQAWDEVAASFATPLAQQAARLFLANAILEAATADSRDADQLRDVGRRALVLKYPWLAEPESRARQQ